MLRSLHPEELGPAPKMDVELSDRLDVFTGDSGRGKSFTLDWNRATVMSGNCSRSSSRSSVNTICEAHRGRD